MNIMIAQTLMAEPSQNPLPSGEGMIAAGVHLHSACIFHDGGHRGRHPSACFCPVVYRCAKENYPRLATLRPSAVSLQISQSGFSGLENQGSAQPRSMQVLTVRGLT